MVQTLQLVHYSLVIRSKKLGPGSYEQWYDDKYVRDLAERFYQSGYFADFVIGKEIGLSDNPHLQIYIRCRTRTRHAPLFKKLEELCECKKEYIQLEPASSPKNIGEYCAKGKDVIRKSDFRNEYENSLLGLDLNPYQKKILDELNLCNSRQLVLASDPQGNSGKSTLVKRLLCDPTYNTVLWPSSGTLNSSLYTVGREFERFRRQNQKITLLVINIVRMDTRVQNQEALSQLMTSVENILDGLWSSSFQQKLLTINQDEKLIRVLITTNKSPNEFLDCLSRDRWRIVTK